jgi:hypothetical protein
MDPNTTPGILDPNSRRECPACGTPRLRAVYGLPTGELVNDQMVKLMGCLIDGDMHKWFCTKCDESKARYFE